MKKNTSYGNLMKDKAQEQQRKNEQYFLSLVANLVLDELCFRENKKRLMDQIDGALQNNDHDAFIKLSKQYKQYYQT